VSFSFGIRIIGVINLILCKSATLTKPASAAAFAAATSGSREERDAPFNLEMRHVE